MTLCDKWCIYYFDNKFCTADGGYMPVKNITLCEKYKRFLANPLETQLAAAESALAAERKGREQAEANAKHFESLYRAAKVEVNFKDSECDRLQEEIEALKVSNSIDAAGNEQFQKAFERAEQAEASCAAMRGALEYYAGGAKYVQRPDGKVPISDDGGAIARAALSASSPTPTAGEQGTPFDEHCPNPDKEVKS